MLPSPETPSRRWRTSPGLTPRCADVDVIHDHTIGGPLYRHRPAGIPVVTTNHGPFLPRPNSLFQRVQRDTCIVAVSRHQASTADGVHISRVIHHGLDVDGFQSEPATAGMPPFLAG